MPDTPPVLRERDGAVEIWTLNRPDTRNAISDDDMVEAVESLVDEVNRSADVHAVIITGAGSAFSSGGNVKHMRDRAGMFAGAPAEIRQGYRHGIQRIPRAMARLEVPAIAAVNGAAVGAGCDLTLMCDIRIAAESAVFAESFVKVGLIPGDGGAWLLPRAVGMSRASEMAFTGDAIDAATALEWGLVSRVVLSADLLPEARRLAARIAANPGQVLRMTKSLLRQGQHQSLDALLELSAAMQAIAHHTGDHHEAVDAMLARRPPEFTGA
jgi:enoyl-CoA hydratase/carnithine racemase